MDYLRDGDANAMARVFYHNRLDMLSMVTLASTIIRQFTRPLARDDPQDLISLARWQLALGMSSEAETNLRQLLDSDIGLEAFQQALRQLAGMLKRHDRRSEAVPLWQQLAVTSFDDVSAHVELAKYYEWHDVQLGVALHWTTQALSLAHGLNPANIDVILAELTHRRARLERKIAKGDSSARADMGQEC
jgi:tetratricopeptide (TPR) repeat protein